MSSVWIKMLQVISKSIFHIPVVDVQKGQSKVIVGSKALNLSRL